MPTEKREASLEELWEYVNKLEVLCLGIKHDYLTPPTARELKVGKMFPMIKRKCKEFCPACEADKVVFGFWAKHPQLE